MAMNPIQFQYGLSMTEFIRHYGTEVKCRRALYRARCSKGFRCPPAMIVADRASGAAGRSSTSAGPASIKPR